MKLSSEDQLELQNGQSEIYPSLGAALISNIPDHWYSARLLMIENDDRIGHVIENPDGERDLVTPTNELFAETRKLEILFQKHNCLWKKASFTITWNHESEDWSFSADYEYSS